MFYLPAAINETPTSLDLTVSLPHDEGVREVFKPDDVGAVILRHETSGGQLVDGSRNHVVVERLAVLLQSDIQTVVHFLKLLATDVAQQRPHLPARRVA